MVIPHGRSPLVGIACILGYIYICSQWRIRNTYKGSKKLYFFQEYVIVTDYAKLKLVQLSDCEEERPQSIKLQKK